MIIIISIKVLRSLSNLRTKLRGSREREREKIKLESSDTTP